MIAVSVLQAARCMYILKARALSGLHQHPCGPVAQKRLSSGDSQPQRTNELMYKTSESGHSEKRTHSLERTKLRVPNTPETTP